MVAEENFMTNKYVVVKEKDVMNANSESEASEIMEILSSQHPQDKYCILEVHPTRPKGMGRDPDLY